jgi:hypothetical protein
VQVPPSGTQPSLEQREDPGRGDVDELQLLEVERELALRGVPDRIKQPRQVACRAGVDLPDQVHDTS